MGFGGPGKEAVHGFEQAGRVGGNEADGFAIDDEAVFAEGGFKDDVLLGRDSGELGELEIDGTKAIEERDEAIGVAAAASEVLGAELAPGVGDGKVELFLANATEDVGLGGGTTSADRGERAALAEDETEVENLARAFGGLGVGQNCPAFVEAVIHKKGFKRHRTQKSGPPMARFPLPELLPD